jgi:hypothetical protein
MPFIDKDMDQSDRLKALLAEPLGRTITIVTDDSGQPITLKVLSASGGWIHSLSAVSPVDLDVFLDELQTVVAATRAAAPKPGQALVQKLTNK